MEQVLLLPGLYKRGIVTLVSIINLQGIILVKLRSCGESLGESFQEFDLFWLMKRKKTFYRTIIGCEF